MLMWYNMTDMSTEIDNLNNILRQEVPERNYLISGNILQCTGKVLNKEQPTLKGCYINTPAA